MGRRAVEEVYQKKTQHEHILSRPDMYIGTIEPVTEEIWVFDEATQFMTQRTCIWIPGLYKIFDEILINAADNKVRDVSQTTIKVTIDKEKGMVRVWNNGEGIPIAIHQKHNLWIPEMIFGHLLTSSNYDDTEKKVTGGRNGFGAKLTNVFSKRFEIETLHSRSKKKFKMIWTKNMLEHKDPEITPCGPDDKDYTQVTFFPDFEKFNTLGFEEDIVLIMKRRVYDVAASSHGLMKCYLNGTRLSIASFFDYVDLYPTFGEEKSAKSCVRVSDRWEVCVRVSNIGYQHVSFVNSIATTRGGNHVRYITDQIIQKVIEQAKKKSKVEIKPHMIRQHLWVFINCLIDNPGFDSQTKEILNTTKSSFGSTCDLPNKFIDYILKSGIVERAITVANSKLTREMAAKVKFSDRKRILGIPKLEDANDAGGKYSSECTLILTEGDSAKALCMAGLSVVGKDRFGVFPLRGKPLNVREASLKKVSECEEIQSVLKIVGLNVSQNYNSVEGLRYGHVMIMSDQDCDGSHIKGLIINMFQHFWPGLYAIPGFLQQFITPIVRVWIPSRPQHKRSFYSMPEYLRWKESLTAQQLAKYNIRYFKGLGTSEPEDGREYFSNIAVHRLQFVRENERDDERMMMAFSKDKIEERKQWITNFRCADINPEALMDYTVKHVNYADFIDKELILFSIADCERSIPSVVDGLKPGQRKILFSCFKRNLTRSIKVSQLSGYVSEQSAYHHGEASLHATIVTMAQNFVGANNLPLLKAEGTFGSRLAGGKDHAAARYIFTSLSDFTRLLFNKNDDYVLTYRDDDGLSVEPHCYVPIIPFVLVNGTSGIGTGFATNIPNYNPIDIIANCERLLDGLEVQPMTPWYYGYKGTIIEREKGKFISQGKYTIQHDGVITISELPIGVWTNQFKKSLEELIEKELIVTMRDNNSDSAIDTDVMLHPDVLQTWQEQGVLEDKLGLNSYIYASNIIAFNIHGQLTKYADAEAVLKEFYLIRLDFYEQRKQHLLADLTYEKTKLANMMRFVTEVVNGSLIVTRRPRKELLEDLKSRNYDAFPPKQKKKMSSTTIQYNEIDAQEVQDDNLDAERAFMRIHNDSTTPDVVAATRDYDYLLGMKIWNLTKEMIEYLQNQLRKAENDFIILQNTSIKEIWRQDLQILRDGIKKYISTRDAAVEVEIRKRNIRRPLIASKVRVPLLSDKARVLIKPSAKALKVMKSAVESTASGSVADAVKMVPNPPPKRKRMKKEDDEDDNFSFDGNEDSSEDNNNEEEGDSSSNNDPPKQARARKLVKTEKGFKAERKTMKRGLSNGKASVSPTNNPNGSFNIFDDTDDPFSMFGLTNSPNDNIGKLTAVPFKKEHTEIHQAIIADVSPTAYSYSSASPTDVNTPSAPKVTIPSFFSKVTSISQPSSAPPPLLPPKPQSSNFFDDEDNLLFVSSSAALTTVTNNISAVINSIPFKLTSVAPVAPQRPAMGVKIPARTPPKNFGEQGKELTKKDRKTKRDDSEANDNDDEESEEENDSSSDDFDDDESEDWD